MSNAKIGLQLIVYRGRQNEDLAGVLKEVAAVGYAGVEGGNFFRNYDPQQVKDIYAETGLACTGLHTGYAEYADEAKLAENIQFCQEMGAKHIICSGVAPGEGIQCYDTGAETFNRAGQICKDAGLTFCYHNHAWEFTSFDGVKGIHRLIERTNPEVVKLNIDVYWVHIGGENPAAFVRKYADRAGYYHFKDGSKGVFAELGRGEVDLVGAKDAAVEAGIDWVVCEQDRSELPAAEAIKISYDYLKSIGL